MPPEKSDRQAREREVVRPEERGRARRRCRRRRSRSGRRRRRRATTTGSPSSAGVVRRRRRRRRGGHRRSGVAAPTSGRPSPAPTGARRARALRDVAVEVRVRQRHRSRVRELERLEQRRSSDGRACDVRVPVAVVVLEPLAPTRFELHASTYACARWRRGVPFSSMNMPTHAIGFSFGRMYTTGSFFLHLHPVVRPRVGDPDVARHRTPARGRSRTTRSVRERASSSSGSSRDRSSSASVWFQGFFALR